MSKLLINKDLFKQLLRSAARDDLIGHFDSTISGYEEQIIRQQKLLDVILKQTADVQQLLVSKEEDPPEQQERSSSLDQEDPPEPPHIKEEQEELWTNQEGEQLRGLQEADVSKISRFQHLNEFFKQQLRTAAREDLIVHFDTTVSRYEEEIDRQQKLLDVMFQPEVKLLRAVFPAEPPHIKEEQEELWTNQEGEQLQDITKFTLTPVPVKTEEDDDEEKLQLLQRKTEQMKTEADGEDCGGPEPDRNSDPDAHLTPDTDDKTEDFSAPETDDDDDDEDWKDPKSYDCSVCGKTFRNRGNLNVHMRIHTGEKSFSCSFCGKSFPQKIGLENHLKSHTGVKPFSCSVCNKTFRDKNTLTYHRTTVHAGVKPFSCTDCGKRFGGRSQLKIHKCVNESSQVQRADKPKKPLTCKECDATFPNNYLLTTHVRMHKGKKLFTCSVCGKKLQFSSHLEIHMRTHTGEKPYSCSVCGKGFSQKGIMTQHMAIHSGVKPFSCSVCGRQFSWQFQIKRHKCLGRSSQHRKTGEGSEPVRTGNLSRHLKPDTYKESKLSSEADDSADIEFWKETRQHQSGFTYQRNIKVNEGYNSVKKFSCSGEMDETDESADKDTRQHQSALNHLQNVEVSVSDTGSNTDMKPFRCSEDSLTLQRRTGGGSEPVRIMNPFRHLKPDADKETKLSSETEDSADFEFWKETRQHQSGVTYQRNLKVSVNEGYNSVKKPFICSGEMDETDQSVNKETRQHQSGLNCEEVSVSDTGSNIDMKPFRPFDGSHTQMQTHTGEKPFSCLFCGKDFATGGYLTRHISVHIGEKRLSCIICEKTFSLESELISHECVGESSQFHHSQTMEQMTANRSFRCSQCGKGFGRKHHLQVHMRIHTGEKPFVCTACGKRFSRRESLNVHMTCHTGEKPFHCSVCHTGFIDSDTLVKHMRIHTGQTQFSCSICGEEFAWRRYLTKHMEVHKKEKIYSCSGHQSSQLHESQTEENREGEPLSSSSEQMETETDGEDCGEPEPEKNSDPDTHSEPHTDHSADSEVWKDDRKLQETGMKQRSYSFIDHPLKTHIHNHTGEKPFSCSICEEHFTERERLSQHMDIHTGCYRRQKQEDPEPPHIKEEKEEVWISQEAEQLQDIIKFTSTPVRVKSEDNDDDEEKPQSSQLHQTQTDQMKTEADGEDCGGPEPDRKSDLERHLTPDTDDSADSDFWKETRERPSSLNSDEISKSVLGCDSGKRVFMCSDEKASESLEPESDNSVDSDFWKDDRKLQETHRKPYGCSDCDKRFAHIHHMKNHMRFHTREKAPFFCSVCGQECLYKSHLKIHMRTHTGEKPFICPVCGKKYAHKASMQSHMVVHTIQKQYTCSACQKGFAWYTELKYHKCDGETSHEMPYCREIM